MSLDITFIRVDNFPYTDEVFTINITHNLAMMAKEAGIYDAMWNPHRLSDEYKNKPSRFNSLNEEWEFCIKNAVRAKKLIDPLMEGLTKMLEDPDHYEKFNPENGWGSYDTFVSSVESVLDAAETYPNSFVTISK